MEAEVPASPSSSIMLHNEDPLRVTNDAPLSAWPPVGSTFSGDPVAPPGSHCDDPGPGGLPMLPPQPAEVCVQHMTITIESAKSTPTPCAPEVCTPTPTGPPPGEGCAGALLQPTDDESTSFLPLGFSINFFGTSYNGLYVNNNGNLTFNGALSAFDPMVLGDVPLPIIAPFFADVDTREAGIVSYGGAQVDGHDAFCAQWDEVGYFDRHADKLNTFRVFIVERADIANGDFDIILQYEQVQWESGDASGGVGGLGGDSARAGYAKGGSFYEIDGSGLPGCFLDSSPSGLIHHNRDAADGTYRFEMRSASGPTISQPPLTCLGGTQSTPTPTSMATATRTPTPATLRGDADCDDEVTSIDAALDLQDEAGLIASVPCPQGGDYNRDGMINSIDAALILQDVAGFI
jgi:hypothetical protein